MKKLLYISGFLLLMPLIVGCDPKEEIITKEVTKVSVIKVSSVYEPEHKIVKEIVFESIEEELVEEVVSEINNSRRPGSWDTLGSPYNLVLTTEEDEEIELGLYYDTGHVTKGQNKVMTGFDFYKEKPWWKFW
ncbi:hypothetical protein V1502_10630 [Bacillus sp. SCS-153A]|uniref:hypothetical protein n=1 Tax=Rossellomorea sedimentorum TaxID=3115294 RepID=UPI003905B321